MPLIRIERVNKNRSVALWKITEPYQWFVQELKPSKGDLAIIEDYRSELKRVEWLAGRITVKTLAEHFNIDYQGISKNNDGKPLLNNGNEEISLTHSYPYVAAILDVSKEVGIDLEQPTEKLRRIAKKFLSVEEKEFVKDNLKKLCICWCAKEALYKLYSKRGLRFSEHLHILPFDLEQHGFISGSIITNDTEKSHKLRYEVNPEFVLTYTV